MGVQAGEIPSSVLAFAPKKERPDATEGHAMTTVTADGAVEERVHASEARAKAAEERAREFEAEANYFRDRAARAEKWLLRIQTEIDQTFFQKRNNTTYTNANQPR